MITDSRRFAPIMTFGLILAVIGLAGLFMSYNLITKFDVGSTMNYFALTMSLWSFLSGLGIIFKRPWGFYLLKSQIYLFYICVPIGTYIAYKLSKYIKENEIKAIFVRKTIEL